MIGIGNKERGSRLPWRLTTRLVEHPTKGGKGGFKTKMRRLIFFIVRYEFKIIGL